MEKVLAEELDIETPGEQEVPEEFNIDPLFKETSEEEFDIEFTDDLLARDTFQSIDKLARTISQLRATVRS